MRAHTPRLSPDIYIPCMYASLERIERHRPLRFLVRGIMFQDILFNFDRSVLRKKKKKGNIRLERRKMWHAVSWKDSSLPIPLDFHPDFRLATVFRRDYVTWLRTRSLHRSHDDPRSECFDLNQASLNDFHDATFPRHMLRFASTLSHISITTNE